MSGPISDASLMAMRLNDGVLGYDSATDSYVITTTNVLSDLDKKKLSDMTDKPCRFEVFSKGGV